MHTRRGRLGRKTAFPMQKEIPGLYVGRKTAFSMQKGYRAGKPLLLHGGA